MIAAAFIVAAYIGLVVEFGWPGLLVSAVHMVAMLAVKAWPPKK